ncbi:MAG: OmpA family protein [Paramuribaculum sp.]|nr:OmpA family protein [Paramuribaculum sp.]
MKSLWKKISENGVASPLRGLSLWLSLTFFVIGSVNPLYSQVFYSDPFEGYAEETFMDMDFEPNLATPPVPDTEKAAVREYMMALASSIKGPFSVDLMRDDEVIVISLPADRLFLPNDTILAEGAERAFEPIHRLMSESHRFKVVLAMHTDDTGNALYRDRISTQRLYSVYDQMLNDIEDGKIDPDIVIIPFAMGDSDPVTDNDTWRHRAENRRLEIYLIPGPELIKLAHEGKLNPPGE